ncbi:MAG TPA: tetratricopeptide repeat protein [Gemmatimonadales bacterium]|nr:tetratricopeptide repeat protein [Gemmatimonadales bacterium]
MSRYPRWVAAGLAAAALGGCATKGDVTRVQEQLEDFRVVSARQDSIRAARLNEVIHLQQQMMDSLDATQSALRTLRGDVANDLYNVQQQLVQLQELTGQSQQRLTELRTQLEARGEQIADTGAAGQPPAGGNPSADQMYEASLQQLRRGSTSTARLGLRQLLSSYPQSEHAADAVYFIGESFAAENPDSAEVYYRQVVTQYPSSPRAATSLYKLGLLAERAKDTAGAREAYQTLLKQYPRSDEANLARDRLKSLGH